MSEKLIGAVSLKVKPDTRNFRDEADRDLNRQMRGWDKDVNVKAKVDADTAPARRKLEDLKRKARESLQVDVDLKPVSGTRWLEYADDAKRNLRRIKFEMEKLDSDASNGMARNWAQRKGQLRKEAEEYRGLIRAIVTEARGAGRADEAIGFTGIQQSIGKLAAQQQRLSRISEDSWDRTAKAVDRYQNALKRLSDHERNDDGSLEWTSQGVKLLEAVETMERQVEALKKQDVQLTDLTRRWDMLGNAQKRAVSGVMTSQNNADIERAQQDIEEFRKGLVSMSTMQVANLRKARLEAEKLAAVEAEIENRRRRLRATKTFTDYQISYTTPDSQNNEADREFARQAEIRRQTKYLETLTAIELKHYEAVAKGRAQHHDKMTAEAIRFHDTIVDTEQRYNMIRDEINRRRRQANFNGTQYDMSRWLADQNRVERENLAHLARMQAATDSYHRTARQSRQKHYDDMFGIGLDVNLQRDLDKLTRMYEDALSPGKPRGEWEKIRVQMDDDSIRKVRERYEQLKREIEDIKADVIANPTGFMAVAAQLKWLTRPRTVNIFAKVHGRSMDIARDTLKSLAGINVAQNLGKQFEDAFRNLDQHIMKVGRLGVLLGSVGAAALGAAGSIASVGAGLVQSVGLLAMLPTVAYAGAASFGVFKIAFADFANAFHDIPIVAEQALAALPPLARKAVEELRGTWTSIRVPVQEAFWGQMGDSIGQLKKRIIPQIREGLLMLAPEAAKATKGVLDSFLTIADNGQLRKMLENTGAMMRNAAAGAEPLFDAINRLGLRGSEYLPKFGKWMADGAKGFDQWIKKADEAGKINRWIEDGVRSVQDFGSAVVGAGKMLNGFAQAALAAGGPTLGALARGLNNVGDSMNREPFRSRMATLFDGAFRGVGNLTEGVKALSRSVGENANFWAELLDVTTSVAQVNMENIARFMSNNHAQSGVLLAFEGMLDLANQLGPSFDNVAEIVGNVGRVAHASFNSMAPIINTITSGISDVVANLTDGAIAAIPALTGQVNAGLTTLGEVLRTVSSGVGGVAEGFGKLPTPIQQGVTALGAFLLMRGSLGRMMETLGNVGPINKMRDSLILAAGSNTKMVESIGRMGPAAVVYNTAAGHVTKFSDQITTSGKRMEAVKGVGRGLFSLIGGGWGLALGAVTVATTLWAKAQAEARARTEELQSTLDSATGSVTAMTEASLSKTLGEEELGFFDKWAGRTMTVAESAEALGYSQRELAEIVAKGGPEYDSLIEKLGSLETGLGGLDEGLSALDSAALKQWMVENREALSDGEKAIADFNIKTKELSESTGMSEGAAGRLQAAFETLASETATADQKLQAFKQTLDSLKDGQLSAQEAARQLERAWESALNGLDGIDKTKVKFKSFFDEATGQFTRFDGAAGKIYDSAKAIMDGVHESGRAAYQAAVDGGDSAELAAEKAAAAMEISQGKLKKFAEDAGISIEQAQAIFGSFTEEDWMVTAIFSADAELFHEAWREANARGEEFTQEDWQAILSADGTDAEAAIARARIAGVEFDESEYQAVLKGTDDQFQQAVEWAKTAGVEFSAELYTAMLSGEPEQAIFAATVAKNAGIEFSDGLYQAVLSGNHDQFMAIAEGAGEKGREFADAIYMAYLEANPDPATRNTDKARDWAEKFAKDPYKATIDATNVKAIGMIREAANKGKEFSQDDYTALLKALDQTSPGTSEAIRTIMAMTGKDYRAVIEALNKTHNGKDSAQKTINSTKGKKVDITASNKTAAGRQSVRNSLSGLSFTASVFGSYKGWARMPYISPLSVVVNGVLGAVGKANGGLLDALGIPIKFDASMAAHIPGKAFANGGIESHAAQIASPSTHSVRVWAEPETGGEAYIPLAASKRTRSVAIWRETGRRLGVYADGGIEGGQPTAASRQNIFNITNNYPVAEKTSTTINRALQYAGVPDFME